MTQSEIFNAAIQFAIDQGSDANAFLIAWREGDVSAWPDFKFVMVAEKYLAQPEKKSLKDMTESDFDAVYDFGQPEQESVVAWMTAYGNIMHAKGYSAWLRFDGGKGRERFSDYVIPLYTAPPKPEMQDWEGIAADQAMTIALMKSEQEPWCWRIDASNHSYFGETAELEARHEAKRIGGTCQAFPLYTAPPIALTAPIGWNNGLSQDYDKKLGAWFSEKPNAKEELRARTFDNYEIKELNT